MKKFRIIYYTLVAAFFLFLSLTGIGDQISIWIIIFLGIAFGIVGEILAHDDRLRNI